MVTKNGFVEIHKRETGLFGSRRFARRFSANEGIVKRVDLYQELKSPNGSAIKTVEFNSTGDLLVSVSEDGHVIFWNWETKTRRLSYDSGHSERVLHTRLMPFSDNRRIATASCDGQVRLGQVLDDGRVETKCLGSHQRNAAQKVTGEPGNPHIIYSCGGDAFVQQYDLRCSSATKLLHISPLTTRRHVTVSLLDMVFDPCNPNFFALGGSETYVRIYDTRKLEQDASSNSDKPVNTFSPVHLIGRKNNFVTGLDYSNSSELLVSYFDELIYLFQKNMGLGPSPPPSALPEDKLLKLENQLEKPTVFLGHRNFRERKKATFFGPNDDYVSSGSDCGHIFIWKKNGAKLTRVMNADFWAVNLIEPHPHIPILATCGREGIAKLWSPMATDAPPLPYNIERIMKSNKEEQGQWWI